MFLELASLGDIHILASYREIDSNSRFLSIVRIQDDCIQYFLGSNGIVATSRDTKQEGSTFSPLKLVIRHPSLPESIELINQSLSGMLRVTKFQCLRTKR
jgi:hypothetical protein